MTAPHADAATLLATGLRLHRAGDWAAAIAVYGRLLETPLAPSAYANRGAALRRLGRLDEAAASCIEALARRPDLAEAYANLGAILQESGHPLAALDACRRAAALAPGLHTACIARANALQDLGEHARCLQALTRAVRLAPGSAAARYNLAEALLRHGRYEEGWRHYEWRWQLPGLGFRRPAGGKPGWTGQDLSGKTLLVEEEQGFGDTLQFVRLLVPVKALGAGIILHCRRPLARLLSGMPTVDAVVTATPDPAAYDYRIPLMSLMHRLGMTLDRIPAAPYLAPPPETVRRWAGTVPATGRLRVGLVWAGDPKLGRAGLARMDARRSMPLTAFTPLLQLDGVDWVSLQKGTAAGQLGGVEDGRRILDPMGGVEDYADTAAIIRQLDLVIGVDTSVVHLAGALGVPAWVLSRFDGCWRWLIDRDDSPWYPSLRLFRQRRPGDWAEVVGRVREELLRLAAEPRHHRRPA